MLGLREIPKSAALVARGGVWFGNSSIQLHLGVDTDFRPARKALPTVRVDNLKELATACQATGYPPEFDSAMPHVPRFYVADPFGNRLEFLQLKSASVKDRA